MVWKYLPGAGGDGFFFVIVAIFVIVGIVSNLLKKLGPGAQKPGSTPPNGRQGPRSFSDLIEQVRKMAEGDEGKPPGPPAGPHESPTAFRSPGQGAPQPRQPVRMPTVPKLRPVGQVRQPAALTQPGKPKPLMTEQGTVQRTVFSEEEEREKAMKMEAEKRERERSRMAERERREIERQKEVAEPLSSLDQKGETLSVMARRKPERRAYARPETLMPGAAGAVISDYRDLFKSPQAIKNAIVLREILGPPRAKRRFRARSH